MPWSFAVQSRRQHAGNARIAHAFNQAGRLRQVVKLKWNGVAPRLVTTPGEKACFFLEGEVNAPNQLMNVATCKKGAVCTFIRQRYPRERCIDEDEAVSGVVCGQRELNNFHPCPGGYGPERPKMGCRRCGCATSRPLFVVSLRAGLNSRNNVHLFLLLHPRNKKYINLPS